jgi:hypothetical protein
VALLLTDQSRTQLARSFYRDIYTENDYFYFYASRPLPWTNDLVPTDPEDAQVQINDLRRQTLFVKRVQGSDACLLARRVNWVSGTVYDQYDDAYTSDNPAASGATSLATSNFYVMTTDFNVYKCIENNGGLPSTRKPVSTGAEIFELNDGYKWKFMFQVTVADRGNFLTDNYIPVRKASGSGQPAYDVNGEIDTITIDNGGSGYTSAPIVTIEGDGTGASATATLTTGVVTGITLDTEGFGYSFAYVKFTGGGGSGALASITLGSTESDSLQTNVESQAVPGTIDRIDVTASGTDYTSGDAIVTIEGDGTGASAIPVINSRGEITSITVVSPGTGYTFANITITQAIGTGVNAVLRAVISPISGHGSHAQKELFAKNLGMNVSFANNNEDIVVGDPLASTPPAGQDFRQIGIVKNLTKYDSSDLFDSVTGTPCHVIGVTNTADYNLDDVITTSDGGKFVVIQKVDSDNDNTYDKVYLQHYYGNITLSSILSNATTGTSGHTINSLTLPEVDVFTGDVLYVDNRRPVVRDIDQTETIKVVFRF